MLEKFYSKKGGLNHTNDFIIERHKIGYFKENFYVSKVNFHIICNI